MKEESRIQPPLMPYPWQGAQWDHLVAQKEAARLPHAVLLNGPEHVGKGQFARALAQLMLCNEPLGGYACGRCKTCKLVGAGNHPDLLRVAPEEAGKAIRIDPIRALRDFVSKTAQQGGWKVALVEPAEAMNVNAANALLKSLEEPSPKTLLILVCHRLSGIPATIRSRCRLLPFAVPPKQQSLNWLRQVSTGDHSPEWLLEQAMGRPLLALKLVESDLLEQQEAFVSLLADVANVDLSAIVAAERCYRLSALEALAWLTQEVEKRIRQLAGQAAGRKWFKYRDRLLSARRELLGATNPNPQLLWESLLMDWRAMAADGSGN